MREIEMIDWAYLELQLRPHTAVFLSAKDLPASCNSSKALANMFKTISKFESGWDPKQTYQEPPPPKGPGTLSIGLFQMSYGDGNGCPRNKKEGDLMEPKVNIDCAVKKAVALVKRDGVLSVEKKGLARYWSVIRPGHHKEEILRSCK
jgi:hypothetical protein